jgi:Rod binding domain-containing protein
MSAIAGLGSSSPAALPPINEALLPASIRNGTPAAKSAYQTALGFEEVLVNQLSQAMMQTVSSSSDDGSSDDGSSDGSSGLTSAGPAGGEYSQLLPQALTSGIMSAGGLGIAQQIATALDPAIGTDPTASQPSGGATASSGAAS